MFAIEPSNSMVLPLFSAAKDPIDSAQLSEARRSAANSLLLSLVKTGLASGSLEEVALASGCSVVVAPAVDGLLGFGSSGQERSIVSRGAPDAGAPAAGDWLHTSQLDSLTTPKTPPPSTLTSSSKPASLMALLATS